MSDNVQPLPSTTCTCLADHLVRGRSHFRPGLHWSQLPALHATIAHRIPADCYLSPGLPWNLRQRVVGPPPGMQFATGTSVAEGGVPVVPTDAVVPTTQPAAP